VLLLRHIPSALVVQGFCNTVYPSILHSSCFQQQSGLGNKDRPHRATGRGNMQSSKGTTPGVTRYIAVNLEGSGVLAEVQGLLTLADRAAFYVRGSRCVHVCVMQFENHRKRDYWLAKGRPQGARAQPVDPQQLCCVLPAVQLCWALTCCVGPLFVVYPQLRHRTRPKT